MTEPNIHEPASPAGPPGRSGNGDTALGPNDDSIWSRLIARLISPSPKKRLLVFLLSDIACILAGLYLAILLRFEFTFPGEYRAVYPLWATILVVVRVFFLAWMGLYTVNWRFVGIVDLKNIIRAMLLSALLIFLTDQILLDQAKVLFLSRGVLTIETVLSFALISFVRIAKRLFYTFFQNVDGVPTMIVGLNGLGERLVTELLGQREEALRPAVIIENNREKENTKVHGVPVVCGYDRIKECIRRYGIRTVLINFKLGERQHVKEIFELIHQAGVRDVRIIPGIDEYGSEVFKIKQFKQLAIEDLMARPPVRIDESGIRDFLKGKIVLVTGAAGSIGSEIVRKLIAFGARQIIAFEIDETELFNLNREIAYLNRKEGTKLITVLGDVRDYDKLDQTFAKYKPDIVFHASAYKHVPMLEDFPEEAVKTNVFGTRNLAECAVKHGCRMVINISTDKAVNPGSIMGASKRIAEWICQAENNERTRFVSVRFGNVLGSRGSVIPIFLDQIKKGGPLTVTHPDMKRYFMSIPEAVQLVFQASYMGNGGEVFVLDMGEPVRIVDLACNLIRMNGLEPEKDIQIQYTGLRPGEKLFEELLTAEEGVNATTHEKVFIARQSDMVSYIDIAKSLQELEDDLITPHQVAEAMKRRVPFAEYTN